MSRGIDSLAECPPPVRTSIITSERLGPPTSAPGSLLPTGRASDPSTRMFVADSSGSPPPSSAPDTEAGTP